jgi:hypothetical protein
MFREPGEASPPFPGVGDAKLWEETDLLIGLREGDGNRRHYR